MCVKAQMIKSMLLTFNSDCMRRWQEGGGVGGEATNAFKVPQFSGLVLEFSVNEIRGGEDKGPCVIAAHTEGRFFNSRSFICKPTTSYCKDQNILRVRCFGEENSPWEWVISQGIWERSPDQGLMMGLVPGAGGKGLLFREKNSWKQETQGYKNSIWQTKAKEVKSKCTCCCSVTKSYSTLCDPHGLRHARLPCPSPSPGVCSNLCPLSGWCHPTILFPVVHLLPSIFPSIGVFSNESVLCIRWPKYWSFSFSISPCNEYSRLISFRMDWLDLLAVQRTLKSLLQYHSSKASIFQCSAFFMV